MVVENVGINAINIYFPKNAVQQSELEKFYNVSTGKYTIGLGQEEMGFCADNEDITSISLTVTQKLLTDYDIDPNSIGFLAVGTETLIDKSKSVKTELMKLFPTNSDIEGVDVKNACFGGTQAVFHAIDWVYSNYETEKRHAIAVLADIAVYAEGPARCTGGVGAIAVLISPDAAIPFDRGLRGVYMDSNWDFYKPITKNVSEYPTVDGAQSLSAYLNSVEQCYVSYCQKGKRLYGEDITLDSFSAAMFHSPFVKMVQKGLARIAFKDFCTFNTNSDIFHELGLTAKSNVEDTATIRLLQNAIKDIWEEKTNRNLVLNRRIGNMYTPSLFAQLVASLALRPSENRVLFFAYGSGSASAMFSATFNPEHENLDRMRVICKSAVDRLEDRVIQPPEVFQAALKRREELLVADVPISPISNEDNKYPLFEGTYFLSTIDNLYRRSYATFPIKNGVSTHVNGCSTGDA